MTWLNNRKTVTKLILGFGALLAIVASMGFFSIHGIQEVREYLNIVYVDYTVAGTDLAKVSTNLIRYRNNIVLAVNAKDQVSMEALLAPQDKLKKQVLASLEAYAATVLRISSSGRDEKKDLERLREALNSYLTSAQVSIDLNREAWRAKTPAEAATFQEKAKDNAAKDAGPKLEMAAAALDELVETVAAVAKDMNEEGERTYQGVLWRIGVGASLASVLCLVMGFGFTRIIARPLVRAVAVLEAVAARDFTHRLEYDSADEIGQMGKALNKALVEIGTALGEVRAVSGTVASAAHQLSAASQEIASGAQEQASSLEETASSLEEITSTVKQNADSAQQARQLASGSREVAEKGSQVVAEAIKAMAEINQASTKIADIITTIDEIAFQTNLLALNAAVEAARAGEQGRGFAVVAAEVRTLAQRSASAAKEIKNLIQDSVRKVDNGTELVNRSGQALTEIVTSVKRVTDIIAEIAAASKEQSVGISQVNQAVTQMDAVTQTNASQTEELSSTSQSLRSHAEQLQELVGRFQLHEGERERPSPPKHPAAPKEASMPVARPASRLPVSKKSPPKAEKAGLVSISNGKHELDLIGSDSDRHGNDGFQEF